MENTTSETPTPTISPTDAGMLIAGIASAIAAIVYSLKHVKKSNCCGGCIACEQETETEVDVVIPPEYAQQSNV